jgi:hypothetical protein
MTLPYKRNFSAGRQADQFLTDDMHKIYETVRHVNESPDANEEPELKLHKALWLDDNGYQLKYADKTKNKWLPIFGSKFQMIDQIMSETVPATPISGQLWIHNNMMYYFNGVQWEAIQATTPDDSQFGQNSFADFIMVSPLLASGSNVAQITLDDDFYEHYYHDNLDYKEKEEIIITDKKWTPDWTNPFIEPEKKDIPLNAKTQYILPSIKQDRFFLDHQLHTDFEKVSSVCLQYPTKDILNKTASGIH